MEYTKTLMAMTATSTPMRAAVSFQWVGGLVVDVVMECHRIAANVESGVARLTSWNHGVNKRLYLRFCAVGRGGQRTVGVIECRGFVAFVQVSLSQRIIYHPYVAPFSRIVQQILVRRDGRIPID